MKNIVFAGGGTGGHFYPIVAIIRELKKISDNDLKFYFITPEKTKDLILENEGIIFRRVFSGKLRRYLSLRNFASPFQIIYGFIQSLILFKEINPKIVFLKGGYGALPVGLAALFFRIPIIIHESDTKPGLMNKLFHKFSILTLISFKETKNYLRIFPEKIRLIGNPVRDLSSDYSQEEAKIKLEFPESKPLLLVLGGSQGAEEINELIFNLLGKLLVNFSIIHGVGKFGYKNYREKLCKYSDKKKNLPKEYKVYEYFDEDMLRKIYKACDVVISRSGASIIFEISEAKKPAILIPLMNSAANHQLENAYSYMGSGACIVMEKPNLNRNVFFENIVDLIKDKKRIDEMTKAAEHFSKPKAAENIAKIIKENTSKS
ncbi:MAG: undecaprenyldiphospho-muramoylpentapeptide beta-N-acetylglucosaminyltransferase [Candidatus Paceibacterota bacterium]|jgi:UDP-N-acetylglucosamine--N-acetylmuramyl-(pentapeptide) pyrophosphoryl-undecaprenol N-acetylglucosamine transferase